MRILLTGATGLIGSAVHARLRNEHEVIRLGRRRAYSDVIIDLRDGSMAQYDHLPSADALVHCAGVIDEHFRAGDANGYRMATYGAEALANAAALAGVRHFVYVSSSHVYGSLEGRIDEQHPPNPSTHYALAHYCTEQLFCRIAMAYGGQATVLRPNSVYGKLAYPEFFERWSLIPFSFPQEAIQHGMISLKSDGLQRRNFVSSARVAERALTVVESPPLRACKFVNVVGTVTESVRDFADRSARVMHIVTGKPCHVSALPVTLSSPPLAAQKFELISSCEQLENDNGAELDAHLSDLYRSVNLSNSDASLPVRPALWGRECE